jgi:hypothetical protein
VNGARRIEETEDGKRIVERDARLEFRMEGKSTAILAIVQGSPHIYIYHAKKLYAMSAPNVFSDGRVCQDEYGKWISGECEEPPEELDDSLTISPESEISERIFAVTDMFFTSSNNRDLSHTPGIYQIRMPETSEKIPTGTLDTAAAIGMLIGESTMNKALRAHIEKWNGPD